jgi:multiple sugar transport system substrate-binding protein
MKLEHYKHLSRISRRNLLKGAASAVAFASGTFSVGSAFAQQSSSDLRLQLARLPGVGMGTPSDAEWLRVGELCLEPTKANVAEGEFAGVELTFMGLNTAGAHNVIFRGLCKAWETYTGARINWIDLATADLNSRIQQAIALDSVDFDIVQMGPAFEGDLGSRGLMSEVPDWVAEQIDMDDYVDYLKPPVGTWGGKVYRVSIDGDCHNFNYRTDVFSDEALAEQWSAWDGDKAGLDGWGVPKTWQQVQAATKFLAGKEVDGFPTYGYLDHCKPWGGLGFYFLGSRASAYAKHPNDPAWLFDADTMKPRINNPAWVRAIQDVVDALPYEPADQLAMDALGTAFTQFLGGTGSMLAWWGDVGSNARNNASSVVGDISGFSILPGSDDVYNAATQSWEVLHSGPNHAPNMAFLGLGLYVTSKADADATRHKAAWSCAAHLGGKDIALWMSLYPTGQQAYRNSQFNVAEWVAAGYDEAYISNYLASQRDSYNHPNAAIEPRIPGLFQYYSIAEDELAKIYAGQVGAQEGADAIAAAWEEITDRLVRESQIAFYREALGQ